ncbi:MAG TPA: hypothetical protein PK360_13530, partial [bacterium]|nr:hypothetical protein [bacterium]
YLEDNGIIVPDSLLQLAKFMMKNPAVLLGESEKAPLDDYKRELDRLLKKDPDNSILLSERGRICELERFK